MSEDPTTTRRLWQRFVLGSGPLKRTSDRLQVLARVLLVLTLLMALPVALAVATATASSGQALADAESRDRAQVTATLLEDAVAAPADTTGNVAPTARADATWSDATGSTHQGVVRAPVGTKAGGTTTIWVDHRGAVSGAPTDPAAVRSQTLLAGVFTFSGISLAAAMTYVATSRLLERGRMRRWADGWAVVEPVWSRKVP